MEKEEGRVKGFIAFSSLDDHGHVANSERAQNLENIWERVCEWPHLRLTL